jgi:hypothetical protein
MRYAKLGRETRREKAKSCFENAAHTPTVVTREGG